MFVALPIAARQVLSGWAQLLQKLLLMDSKLKNVISGTAFLDETQNVERQNVKTHIVNIKL
jgi:hypothetical protein